jgi:hypothetical protein
VTRAALSTAVLLVVCAGCGEDSTTAPTPNEPITRITEHFTGELEVGGSRSYAFTVTTSGTTNVTLLSLRPAGAATPALTTAVGLGLGTPAGTSCALRTATTVQPALSSQLSAPTNPSIHCVLISDTGNLQGAVTFIIRIVHP